MAALLWAGLLLGGGVTSSHAQVALDAVVTLLPGSVRYDLTVDNGSAEDLVLVSLLDGPIGDPLVGPSLDAPAGFLASYDAGLGLVDFLGDTEVFGSGTTLTGFGFETLPSVTGVFGSFEALGISGALYRGSLNVTVVPESGPVTATLALVGCLAVQTLRRRRSKA